MSAPDAPARIGLVGLGRMGGSMASRLVERGYGVVGHDVDQEHREAAAAAGAEAVASLPALIDVLQPPRVVWIMVPHGEPTRSTIQQLLPILDPDDVLIDGGNSHYPESMRHARAASERGVHFLDIGVSGGVRGREAGYCLMVGGPPDAFERIRPLLEALSAEGGLAHVGPSGSGHFVKMVHNAIEYAMLQALGEGFECLRAGDFDIDLGQVAGLWQHGSVIRCWLLELMEAALARRGPGLEGVGAWVDDSGTGRWTVDFALDNAVPVPSLAIALFERFASRVDERYAYKAIAALRQEFGGHAVQEPGRDG